MRLWRSLLVIAVLMSFSVIPGATAATAVTACGPCEGKVRQLTLRYRGTVRDADIEVRQRDRGDYIPVFQGVIQPQGTFSFSGRDSKETLGPEIRIWVNGVQNARIQTSCETPVGPGLVVGDFEVVEGASRVGGPLCLLAPPPPRPKLRVTKTDALQVDADSSGTVTSGDTVRYTALVSNPGTLAVGNAVYHDAPGTGTSLVAGSVASSRGTVSVGNAANDTLVTVAAGTLAAGESFTVTFDVTVSSAATVVSNQGYASGDGVPGVPTDDPETPQAGDPTLTVLGSRPYLDAVQTVTLHTDADGSSGISAGDTLLASISLRNVGTAPATGVAFSETPGGGTRLVAGSVTAPGTVTLGNGAGDASVAVDLGTLAAGDLAVISYQVTVDSSLPTGTVFLASQGRIRSNEDPAGEATDDPATLADDDATRTLVQGGGVLLSAVKLDTLLLDADGDGQPGPGDALRYLVIVSNAGDADATGVIFLDTPGAHTVLAVGTVATSDGTVTTGNATGDAAVRVALGTVPAGVSVAVAFTIGIDNPLPAGVDGVANQGSVTSNERPALATDDPATPAAGDATATRFAAMAALGGLVWEDGNGNGIRESGEAGRANVAVKLLDGAGLVLRSLVTGIDGSYRFEGLAASDYAVEFTPPVGSVFTARDQGSDDMLDSDADPATGRTATIHLGGGSSLTLDAGLLVRGGLGDFVWDDLDGDGVQDTGEPGLAGVPVRLLSPSGAEIDTTVTSLDGSYRFEGLAAGDYVLEFTAPLDRAFSPRDRGGDDALDSDADPVTGRTGAITLGSTGGNSGVDCGLYSPAFLTGFIWDDGNGDGLQDATERGIPLAAVELLDATGQTVAAASTDAGGGYRFSGLVPGTYSVRFVSLVRFASSPRDQGNDDARDSDADPATGRSAPVLLRPGDEGTADVDAGFFQPVTGLTSSPANGESGIALTRETIFRLSSALAASATIDGSKLFAQFGGNRLAARIHVSPDRRTVTLFYEQPLPASARVRVTFVGDGVPNEFGSDLDADGDGQPGGTAKIDFDTLSLATVAGTRVCGRVFASELAPGDSGSSVNVPLQGVTIHVEGNDALQTVTDSLGNFCLDPAPAGRFFVLIDGRTASNGVPPGTYYPSVGKAWDSVAGQETNAGNVFLPLVPVGTLQPVSRTADTPITFASSVLAQFPEFAGAHVMVPADSLYADNGTRGGQVGIAPVPPDRIPGALPPGLQFPIVITVQTDGATNFDVPLPACLPNLPDPITGRVLQPGEKSALWSFNHDTGEFEVVGPMTVMQDGRLVCTDPGVGIQAPGWHGAQPGSPNDVQPEEPEQPNDPPEPEEPEEPEDCDTFDAISKASSLVSSILGLASEIVPIAQGVTCTVEAFNGAVQIINDLRHAAETGSVSCVVLNLIRVQLDRIVSLVSSCVPGISVASKLNDFCQRASDILNALSTGGELAACLSGTPFASRLSGWISTVNDYVGVAVNAKQRILGFVNPKEQLLSLTADLLGRINDIACTPLTAGSAVTLDQKARADLERIAALLEQVTAADVTIDPETANLSRQVADLMDAQRTAAQQFTPAELTATLQKSGAVRTETDLVGRRIVRLFSKPVARPIFAAITYDDIVLRRTVRGRSQQVLPPNTQVRISLYDPQTNGFAVEEARTEESGRITKMGNYVLMPAAGLPDADGDGLADDAEFVVGTRADHADSDGDGVNDFAEVRQGTDPLNGVLVRTGVIATADTPGTAVDVCALNDIIIMADSQAGISVFNAFNGMEPRIVAQVDTPGTAQAVSCGTSLIAVADGTAGLAVVDISDPPAAQILFQVPLGGSARAVAVTGNIAFVGLDNGQVVSVDMASGSVLERVAVGGAVQDVTINGDMLYTLTVGNLYALRLFNGPLQVAGSVGSPGSVGAGGRRLRLFAGGTIAYATHTQGYNTFDLADPVHPRLIAVGRTAQFGWKQIVANGSGLGVAAVDPNSTNDGAHDVSLYDVGNPNQTDVFLARFETPGLAAAVSIYNGLAYVADSQAGLQVVNYLAYDALGVAPTITLSTNLASNLAEEGKLIRVTANVDDDVQVRNVEFYVDGVKVVTDGNFPFEQRFTTPLLAAQPSFTLRACATDTGGNRTCTGDSVITLTMDATPPRVSSVTPQNGSGVGEGTISAVSAVFSEPVAAASLSGSTFRLFTAGADGIAGNADDVAVGNGTVSYREDVNTAFLTFPSPLTPQLYRAVLSSTVTDLAGNSLGADYTWSFRVRGPQSWINPEGGRWHDPANWSDGAVPGPSDIAFITLSGNYTVVVDQSASVGTLTLGGLAGSPTLWISGASRSGDTTLTVNNDFNSSGIVRLESRDSSWQSNLTVNGLFSSTGTINVSAGTGGNRVINANLVNLGSLSVDQSLFLSRTNGVQLNEGTIRIAAGKTLALAAGQVLRHNAGEIAAFGLLDLQSGCTFDFNGGAVTGTPPLLSNATLNLGAGSSAGSFILRGGNSKLSGDLKVNQTIWIRGDSGVGDTTVTAVNGFTSAGTIRIESQDGGWSSNLAITNGTLINTGTININVGSGGNRQITASLDNRSMLNVSQSLSLSKAGGIHSNTGTIEIASGKTLFVTGASFDNGAGAATRGAGNLSISSAAMSNAGTLTPAGGVQMSNGTLHLNAGTTSGTTFDLTNSALNLGSGGTDAATFILGGGNSRFSGNLSAAQTLWVRGNSQVGDATVTAANGFTSAGTIRIESKDGGWSSNLVVTSGTLISTGTLNVNAGSGGNRQILASLDNRGMFNVNQSVSVSKAGGIHSNTGTIEIAAGKTLSVTGASFDNGAGAAIRGAGNLSISSAVVSNTGALTPAGGVQISNGTLNFNAGTASGTILDLTNSALNVGAGGTGAATFILGGSNSRFSGNLSAAQTLWVRGNSQVGDATVTAATGFTNAGTIRIESKDGGWSSNLVVTSGTLINTGTIDINTGTGGNRALSADVLNQGTWTVNLSLNLPKSNASYVNEGTLQVVAGQTLSMGSGSFDQRAGGLSVNGAFNVSSATFTYSGGTISGNPPLLTNATLSLGAGTGAASFTLKGGNSKLTGNVGVGQTLWVRGDSSVGDTTLTSATGFTNAGTILLESRDGGWSSNLVVTSGTLISTGTLNVNTGAGGNRQILANLDNRGTMNINQSVSVSKTGGIHSNTGTIEIASGKTLSVTGASFDNGAGAAIRGAGNLSISSAVVSNTGALTPAGGVQISNGTLNFNAGTASGTTFDLTNSALNVGAGGTGAATFILGGGNSRFSGNLSAAQTLWVRGNSQVGDATVTAAAGFTNAGTIRIESKDGGWSSNLVVTSGTLINTGTIDINTGTGGNRSLSADVLNQGTWTVNRSLNLPKSNASYVNEGTLQVAAGQTLSMGSGSFDQHAGDLSVNGAFNVSSATFTYSGGTISGNPPLLTNATLSLGAGTGAASFTLKGGNSKLAGNVGVGQTLWVRGDSSVGDTTLTSATGFTNAGTILLESRDGGWSSNLRVTSGTLLNTGTIDVNLGSGGPRQIFASLDNQGTIGVQIGGVNVNSQFVQLNVTGAITLGGMLDVSLINGFTPAQGQTFRVLGWGSRTGTFGTITGLDFSAGLRFDPGYGATGLTLTVVPAP